MKTIHFFLSVCIMLSFTLDAQKTKLSKNKVQYKQRKGDTSNKAIVPDGSPPIPTKTE